MILKSFLVEKNISLLDKYSFVLFYGENTGLKDEIKFEIKKKYKNYEQINLLQDEIVKNEKLLDEQIHNTSLFSKNKLIFINEVSDKIEKKITENIEKKEGNKILLFTQSLDKKSNLRSLFEKNKETAIIPCYQDNHRTLLECLKKKLQGFSGVSQEVANLLIENSGFDRKVLYNEINKIKSLFLDKKINLEKVSGLLNNAYNIDFDKLRDSCFEGDKKKLNQCLGNIILQNEDAYFYLGSLNQRIQKLSQLQSQYGVDKNMEMAVENMKPKIFWKDKPIFLKQIKKWNSEKLKKAKEIVIETEIKMKTKLNNYNGILIKYLLIRLYQIADSTS
tara:strand:- start:1042 stop:2043 length:1002 start_codon:yes stop_codon:yes gene_type:complete